MSIVSDIKNAGTVVSDRTKTLAEESAVKDWFDRKIGEEMGVKRALLVYTLLLLFYGFLLLPAIWLVLSTFMSTSFMFEPRALPESLDELTLHHYYRVVTHSQMQTYFVNSTVVAVGTTALTLLFGSLGAYSLSRFDYPGNRTLLVGYITTMMLPWVLLLIPFIVVMYRLGLINTRIGVVIVHTALALPLVTWLLKGYFDGIASSLDDAARMDGCSHFQVLYHIIAPLSIPGLAVAGFFTFTVSWNDFLAVSVIAQTDGNRTLPFGLYLFQQANVVDWGAVLTASVYMMIPVVVLFALVQSWIVQGIAGGGQHGH